MAMTSATTAAARATDLQALAKRHLWMHFTRHGVYDTGDVPIIVRGEGPYVWDEAGNRYLDGLSALFCVNAGHGRSELAPLATLELSARSRSLMSDSICSAVETRASCSVTRRWADCRI